MPFLSFLVLHHILSAFFSDEVERLSSKDELSGASFVDIVLEEAVQVVALELDVDPAGRCTSASVFPSLQRLNALCFYFIFGDLALAEVAALVNGLIARKGSVHELTPVVVVRNIPFSMFKFALAACAPPAFPLLVSRFLLEFEGGLDGALLEVEGEESRFIGIVFPFEVFAHDALIDILGCYNSSTMEGSLLLRSKVSNCQPKKVYSYTSPRVEEYEKMASRYQQYVGQLAPKIDSICEKENYRTYLKEQKLHSIRHHLDAKKSLLESNLRQKSDPANSPNGKLHLELQELLKLEDNYRLKRDALQQTIDSQRAEMRRLTTEVQQQREQIKNQLKESFISQSQLQLPKLQRHQPTFLTRNSSASFLSKSRASVLQRLNETNQEQMAQKLTNEEEKLILLKLLCVYARGGIEEGQPHQYLGPETVEYLERDIEIRSKLLAEVQILMRKR